MMEQDSTQKNGKIFVMFEFIAGFLVVAASFALIATGLILKNKPVVGSCGGLANIEEGAPCEICGRTTTGDCLTPKTDS